MPLLSRRGLKVLRFSQVCRLRVRRRTRGESSGELSLSKWLKVSRGTSGSLCDSKSPITMKEHLEGKLGIELRSGTGFEPGVSPYAVVYLSKASLVPKKSCIVKTKKDNHDPAPVWNTKVEKDVKGEYSGIKVVVKDAKKVGKDKPIGEVDVDISQVKAGQPVNGTFPLASKKLLGTDQKAGAIVLGLHYVPTHVMKEFSSTSDSASQ